MKNLLAVFAFVGSVAHAAEVVDVSVKPMDGFGGDVSSAISYCQTTVGSVYDPVTITRDVTMLKKSGEFETIDADAQKTDAGIEVTFYVKRKMRYQAPATVEGAEFFSAARIVRESGLKDGYLYGESDLADAAAKIRALYAGKHFVDARVSAIPTITEGNGCTIAFLVDEGERVEVEDIEFAGVENVDERELRNEIGDFPWWNPIGWFVDSLKTSEQQAQACAKIAAKYREHGYLDVKVTGPDRIPVKEGTCNLRYNVEEGALYRIGETSIEGVTRYDAAVVAAKSELPEAGSIAGEKLLEDAAHRIEVVVGSGDSGLADTHVAVRRVPVKDDPTKLDIVFEVAEGVPVVIDGVLIRGNDYTKDKVIRRQIELNPGDRMLADRAERSQHKLENLPGQYFSRVRYYLEPSGKGKDENGAEYRNLVYEVEEKRTGMFMFGVGASSVDSVFVSAEVSQSNFDLFAPGKLFRGGGQKGRLFLSWGPRIQTYEASITEPHLFDRNLEFTVEGYRRLRWYDEFDIARTGASASLAYPVKFWPTWRPFGKFGVRLSGELVQFEDIEDDEYEYKDETVSLAEEKRKYDDAFEPVVRLFWSKDSRDSYRMPTRGHRTQLFVDVAPAGDNQFYRLGFNHRSYINTWKKYNHVLMLGLRAETIDGLSDDIPIYDRMFLGGPRSIRGIEYRNVSPMARNSDRDNDWMPWGGQTLFCMTAEYTVPIVKMLRVAAFTDLGSVGEDSFDTDFADTFAWTGGFGVRLDIPMFPIRLDFAAPFKKPDHAEKEFFSFTVGYDF